jgi:hypothetical protein
MMKWADCRITSLFAGSSPRFRFVGILAEIDRPMLVYRYPEFP